MEETRTFSVKDDLKHADRCFSCLQDDFAAPEHGFGPRTMLICECCGILQAHVECEEKRTGSKIAKDAVTGDNALWFCSNGCETVHKGMSALVSGQVTFPNLQQSGLSIEVLDPTSSARGVRCQQENALKILHSAFDPLIMDNGRDLLHMVVTRYVTPDDEVSDDDTGHDYGSFRTVVMKKGSTVVCVATLRVFGTIMAELPFVATRDGYRKRGYLKHLMGALEAQLGALGVKQLLVPAVRELKSMWLHKFGFQQLTVGEVDVVEPRIVSPDPESAVLLRKPLGAQAALERPPLPPLPPAAKRPRATDDVQAAQRKRHAAVRASDAISAASTAERAHDDVPRCKSPSRPACSRQPPCARDDDAAYVADDDDEEDDEGDASGDENGLVDELGLDRPAPQPRTPAKRRRRSGSEGEALAAHIKAAANASIALKQGERRGSAAPKTSSAASTQFGAAAAVAAAASEPGLAPRPPAGRKSSSAPRGLGARKSGVASTSQTRAERWRQVRRVLRRKSNAYQQALAFASEHRLAGGLHDTFNHVFSHKMTVDDDAAEVEMYLSTPVSVSLQPPQPTTVPLSSGAADLRHELDGDTENESPPNAPPTSSTAPPRAAAPPAVCELNARSEADAPLLERHHLLQFDSTPGPLGWGGFDRSATEGGAVISAAARHEHGTPDSAARCEDAAAPQAAQQRLPPALPPRPFSSGASSPNTGSPARVPQAVPPTTPQEWPSTPDSLRGVEVDDRQSVLQPIDSNAGRGAATLAAGSALAHSKLLSVLHAVKLAKQKSCAGVVNKKGVEDFLDELELLLQGIAADLACTAVTL